MEDRGDSDMINYQNARDGVISGEKVKRGKELKRVKTCWRGSAVQWILSLIDCWAGEAKVRMER